MSLKKPYKRTVRLLTNGTYSNDGHWQYLLHSEYAMNPQHYVRAYQILQTDLIKLFEYVEPCDQNLQTISLQIHELLTRSCIEIEANFTAILSENKYSASGNWNIKNDYCLIDFSHRLSEYEVKFPIWNGKENIRRPFADWANKNVTNWHVLDWYQAYNKSKHKRHEHFDKATFEHLLNAVSGLVVLLTAQFQDEEYSPVNKSLGISGNYSYDYNPSFETAIGSYFKVSYPKTWGISEQYDFNWEELKKDPNPIDKIDYNEIKSLHIK